MATHRALVLHSRSEPLQLETLPLPTATPGSLIVRVLATNIVTYQSEILTGVRPYPLSLPMTPGNTAIARIHEIGPDTTSLAPGQLVYIDISLRARDNPSVSILYGIHGGGYPAAQKLMDGEWRNGSYAEYAKVPLEIVYALNEEALFKRLGYSVEDLTLFPVLLVPFGGLAEVDVKPGETVIVGPATGRYGGAAVGVALALGATVVALGRNKAALAKLEAIYGATGRLSTVPLTGAAEADAAAIKGSVSNPQGADVYIDFSPPGVGGQLIGLGLDAIRPFGRFVMMGGITDEVSISYPLVMLKSIRIQGRFMYSREYVVRAIQMLECGLIKLGKDVGVETKAFGLEDIDAGLKTAAELTGWGNNVIVTP
ncbi:putative isopropanol dehydrogenase [Thozetella sp. PMI_491]|nr:putative isopropanol dehydrogenase [Thozetella sp. PMI_491]